MFWGLITTVIVIALLLLVATAMKPRERHDSRTRFAPETPAGSRESSRPAPAMHH
ncbi:MULTISPECIES: hypothetical protein [Nocardia]|uniref:hypothetical protein n=1 Tax=Nocardia TaxID=1817 RepID=UPI00130074C0|nr:MULTISPECIES: hypothetical protein [Nocardia]